MKEMILLDLFLCFRIFLLCCFVFVVDKVYTFIGIYTFFYKYMDKNVTQFIFYKIEYVVELFSLNCVQVVEIVCRNFNKKYLIFEIIKLRGIIIINGDLIL